MTREQIDITKEDLKELSYNNINGEETYSLENFKCFKYALNNGGIKYLQNVKILECSIDIRNNIDELRYLKNVTDLYLSNISDEDNRQKLYLGDYMKNIQKLHIYCDYDLESGGNISFHGLKNLTEIQLIYYGIMKCNINDFTDMKLLKTLKLTDVMFENDKNDFREVSGFNCDSVEYIYIETGHSYLNRLLHGFTKLKYLNLEGLFDDDEIIPILKNIEILDLKTIEVADIQRKDISNNIFKYMENMREIYLYYCDEITDDGIYELIKTAPKIKKIRIEKCKKISTELKKMLSEEYF